MAGASALAGDLHFWSAAVAIARFIVVASASTASVEVGTYGVKAFEAPWREQPKSSRPIPRRRLVRQEQGLMLEPASHDGGRAALLHGHSHTGRHRHLARDVDAAGTEGQDDDSLDEANDQPGNDAAESAQDDSPDGTTASVDSTTHPADKFGLGPGAHLDPYNVPQAVIGAAGPVGLSGTSGDVAVPEEAPEEAVIGAAGPVGLSGTSGDVAVPEEAPEEEVPLQKFGSTLDALQGKATYVTKGMVLDLLCWNVVLTCCVFGALCCRLRSKRTPASEAAGAGLHFSIDVVGLQDFKLQQKEEMCGAVQGAIASAIVAEADGLADFGDISVDVVGALSESQHGVQLEVVIGCADAEGLQMKLGSSATIYDTITQSVQGVEGIFEVAEGEVQVSNIGEIGLLT